MVNKLLQCKGGGLQVNGFCLSVELAQEGFVTSMATTSIYFLYILIIITLTILVITRTLCELVNNVNSETQF